MGVALEQADVARTVWAVASGEEAVLDRDRALTDQRAAVGRSDGVLVLAVAGLVTRRSALSVDPTIYRSRADVETRERGRAFAVTEPGLPASPLHSG